MGSLDYSLLMEHEKQVANKEVMSTTGHRVSNIILITVLLKYFLSPFYR